MQFTPLKNFHDDDLRSSYEVGLSYTVRPGNKTLAEKVEGWLSDGLVRLGAPDSPQPTAARLKGAGKIE